MAKFAVDKPPASSRHALAEISVDRDAEVPIGTQLAWALRSRIADGRLGPGMRLPGLREFADSTGVNVNTVRAVYQRLEHESLIDSQHGSGTYVTATPGDSSAASNIAAAAASQARETGTDLRAVAAALYVSAQTQPEVRDEALERRQTLRTEIGVLERTLGDMEADHPARPVRPRRGSHRGPALLDATELERVRAGLLRRLAELQSAIDEGDAVTRRKPAPKAQPKPKPGRVTPEPEASTRRSRPKRPSSRPASAGT
jgi:DNA-binding transcriptional regulator YhcF (GntR family)